ncbi:ComF family protein [Photobacterium lipolyticum]|uniref:Amidophosphoribosyltransferase n=1 Tax=Photobacterium lipolyticum TaxID=266810 RepID=A0A2T3MY82_9GAMM|nr:ComF family protein [Photobacterium lipolyticum]PSW04949.1 amidophosphoribosyltransferase [Photobacterium lipolyticum]
MLSPSSLRSIFQWTNQQCQLCHLPLSPGERVWCHHCLASFPQPPYCSHCGATTLLPVSHCGQCLTSPPPWQRLYRLGEYDFPLRQLIHQLKFGKKFWLAQPLGLLLAQQIDEPAPVILPVPLHPLRRLSRGFNQSNNLARAIATSTDSRCLPHGFCRIRHTKVQKQLTKKEREKNLYQAFILKAKQLPDHIAIVDDVVTTGSTVTELTHLLQNEGVKRVDIYCICYTPAMK